MRTKFIQPVIGLIFIWLMLSGFTLAPSLIPKDQILAGGPPKDGIPALTYPKMEPEAAADHWLKDHDLVLGVVIKGIARAYPVRIMNWHEIVNDRIAGKRFVMTYCPLCGSGMAFDTDDQFGVSGLLYQSDVLLYDKKTDSLWSQLMMQAVTGSRMGEKLIQLPITHASWKTWKAAHPNSSVLSRHTGFHRDYSRNPYAGYESVSDTYFPVYHHDARLPAKTWVIGLSLNGRHKAWTLDKLKQTGSHEIFWQGQHLAMKVNGDDVQMRNIKSGKILPVTRLYWFAWVAFHPATELSAE